MGQITLKKVITLKVEPLCETCLFEFRARVSFSNLSPLTKAARAIASSLSFYSGPDMCRNLADIFKYKI